MVVSGIFILLSGVTLASNTRFGNRIVLENLASDIALSIREAQVYGIAVRRCDPAVTELCNELNQFDVAYGVHFARGESAFELFVDVDGNAAYDPGETVLSTTIASGYHVADLCTTPASGGGETCELDELNIAFRRPEPDACIAGDFDDEDNGECISSIGRGRIVVESSRGDTAEIIVESTGQISVQ